MTGRAAGGGFAWQGEGAGVEWESKVMKTAMLDPVVRWFPFCLAMLPAAAFAHAGGHDSLSAGEAVWHVLTSWYHLLPGAAAFGVAFLVSRRRRVAATARVRKKW